MFFSFYRFLKSSFLWYSWPVEGLRRMLTYDTRETMMCKIMEWAAYRNLEGDYMEFGVYEGDSFIKAFHFAKFSRLRSMKFYAFDSFSGYPPLDGIDKKCGYFKEGWYACDLETFRKNITRAGIDLKRVRTVPGLFNTLSKNAQGRVESKVASVVWIDCDLYRATREALDFLVDYITDGTIIVFADWFTCNGAENMCQPLAVREWLEENPYICLVEYLTFGGKAFIISQPEKQKINKAFPGGL